MVKVLFDGGGASGDGVERPKWTMPKKPMVVDGSNSIGGDCNNWAMDRLFQLLTISLGCRRKNLATVAVDIVAAVVATAVVVVDGGDGGNRLRPGGDEMEGTSNNCRSMSDSDTVRGSRPGPSIGVAVLGDAAGQSVRL